MADSIPVISQCKSLFQYVWGDSEKAKRTQENFSKQCPVISQLRSAGEAFLGRPRDAEKTQIEFAKNIAHSINSSLDYTPGVGHVKGILHYVMDDKDGGDMAMKAASRTTGSLLGGAIGMAVCGAPGAIAGGWVGAVALDTATTMVDSAVHAEFRPSGYVKQIIDIEDDPGLVVDMAITIIADCGTGHAGGKSFQKLQKRKAFEADRRPLEKQVGKPAAKDLVMAADEMKNVRQDYDIPKNKPHITAVVRDLDTNKTYINHNQQIIDVRNKAVGITSRSRTTRTLLQERAPNVMRPLRRRPGTCAEHRAYNDLYHERPQANPKNTRVSVVEFRKSTGTINAAERCGNCKAYDSQMGFPPGDILKNVKIPNHPNIGKCGHLKELVKPPLVNVIEMISEVVEENSIVSEITEVVEENSIVSEITEVVEENSNVSDIMCTPA